MSGRTWYAHNPRDFLDGIVGMTPDLIGAYIVTLDLIYARGAPIPNDARWLSGVMGCSTRLAAALVQRLIDAEKLTLTGGKLSNPRAILEIENAAKFSRNQAESGAKGGRTRAENEANSRKINDVGQASLKQETVQDITEQKERDDDVSASVRASGNFDLLELTNECAKAGGVRHLEPAAIARHVDQVREWQSAGVLPAEMLAWIRDVSSRHTEPIRSLKFFDAHIRQAIARKDNPHGNQSTVVGFGAARIRAGQGNPRAVAARELVAEAVEREQREAALLGEGGGNNWGIGAALPAEWR